MAKAATGKTQFTSTDLSRLSEFNVSSIRMFADSGILECHRDARGHRIFGVEAIKKLKARARITKRFSPI